MVVRLPGFNDTQGTVRNLINSAFIRQILTEARSVRLVIVSGEDEVTASRGETFKRMLESVQKLFKINPECAHNVFRDYSVFVLTKSTHNVLAASASHIMRKSTDEYQALLRTWTGNGRFSHMCHANTVGADWTSEQAAILSLINNSLCGDFRESDEGSRKNTVDISAIYPVNTTRVLEKMFCILMRKKFDDYLEVISNLSKLDEAIDSLKSTSRGSFWQKIDEEVSNVEEVRLLKVFCETPYADARRRFESETSRVLTTKRDRRIKELEDRCATLIETAVTRYHHEQHNETGSARIAAALNHEFHKYIYDSIFGDAILAQVTSGDGKEKEVLRKRWAGFMDEYRKKQIDAYVNCYDKAKDYATSGL